MSNPDACVDKERRTFMARTAAAGALVALSVGAPPASQAKGKAKAEDDEVGPTEDLMREHGILRRILPVYGEGIRRLDARQQLDPEIIAHAATIIRTFIEDYHEKDEEQHIFPRLQKAGKLVDLVNTLLQQHQAGRRLTADILRRATPAGLAAAADRQQLAGSLRLFIRMYEPHAAREDTVVFPAFRELVGPRELDRLKDVFEDKEKALPGGGFEKVLAEVVKLEQALGLYELAQFTPPSP